jgi:hypothetical protein
MMDLVAAGLDQLHERISGRFARAEPRARVREYVSGLVAGLERKNGWTPAQARRARPATPKPGNTAGRNTDRHQPTTVRNTGRMPDLAAKITRAQT